MLFDWLVAHPVRWVTAVLLLLALAGVWLHLRREDRNPASGTSRRRRELETPWAKLPTRVQATYDARVLAASDAAGRRAAELEFERIVRAEAWRIRRELRGKSPASSD